ncbi:MAG: hypothetical protein ACXWMK_03015, partial [Syntrophales bacterium]
HYREIAAPKRAFTGEIGALQRTLDRVAALVVQTLEMVEREVIETDLRIYTLFYDHRKKLIAEIMERHVNLHRF